MTEKKAPVDYPRMSIEEFQAQGDLIQYFYGEEAVPQLYVSTRDIMDIMHCNETTANRLVKEVLEYFEEAHRDYAPEMKEHTVTTWMFCDYMEIDKMLIQLFLLSIHPPEEYEPLDEEPEQGIMGWPISHN
jgi:hypothetical protein